MQQGTADGGDSNVNTAQCAWQNVSTESDKGYSANGTITRRLQVAVVG